MNVKKDADGEVAFDLAAEFIKHNVEPLPEIFNEIIRLVMAATEVEHGTSRPHPFSAYSQQKWELLLKGAPNVFRVYWDHRKDYHVALMLLLLLMEGNMSDVEEQHAAFFFSTADAIYADYTQYLALFDVQKGHRVFFEAGAASKKAKPVPTFTALPEDRDGISTQMLIDDIKNLQKQGHQRDEYYEDLKKKVEVPHVPPLNASDPKSMSSAQTLDFKARADSKKFAAIMDETFASSANVVVRNINQNMTLWLASARLNPNGAENERKLNEKMDVWRQYLYKKKKNGEMTKLAEQMSEFMGDPRLQKTLGAYKADAHLKDRFPTKNSARMLARNNTLDNLLAAVNSGSEKVENTGQKVTSVATFSWGKGMLNGGWISSWFMRTVLAADSPILIVLGGVLGTPWSVPGALGLIFGSLLSYIPQIVMSLTNTQVFDLVLTVLGKIPKMPTAVQIETLIEHMLDKFYPAIKPLMPLFKMVLDFTKPLWNVMVGMIMSKIIELSQQIKDYLTPSDYKQVWTTEKTNLILLRLIHLWAFALRGAESMLTLYINVVWKLVFKVIGLVVSFVK